MPHIRPAINLHPMMRPMNRERGGIIDSPLQPFDGGILSPGAGRSDDIKMHVDNGSYVMPAWAVSHIGQGNSVNGMTLLKMMFGAPQQSAGGPWGAPSPQIHKGGVGIPSAPQLRPAGSQPPMLIPGMSAENPALAQQRGAHGGPARSGDGPVPINASGGEFVIPPEEVAKIGDGDVNKGHRVLDRWVIQLKKEAVATLAKLPGPAK